MTDNERAMYPAISMNRNTELILRWTSSSFFLLIILACMQFMARNKLSFYAMLLIGETIIMVSLFWIITLLRSKRWIIYWESRLDALERSEPAPVTVRAFGGREHERMMSFSVIADGALMAIAMAAILMSLAMLVASFFLA